MQKPQPLEVQNSFLQQVIEEAKDVSLYIRGRKTPIEGMILAYDTFTFVFVETKGDGRQIVRLIMKHSVDYIEPDKFSLKKYMDRLQAKPEPAKTKKDNGR